MFTTVLKQYWKRDATELNRKNSTSSSLLRFNKRKSSKSYDFPSRIEYSIYGNAFLADILPYW